MAGFALEKFARHIHGERWGRGLTMQQVADALKVSKSTVSRWENAKALPNLAQAVDACQFFNLKLVDYIQDELHPLQQLELANMEKAKEAEVIKRFMEKVKMTKQEAAYYFEVWSAE